MNLYLRLRGASASHNHKSLAVLSIRKLTSRRTPDTNFTSTAPSIATLSVVWKNLFGTAVSMKDIWGFTSVSSEISESTGALLCTTSIDSPVLSWRRDRLVRSKSSTSEFEVLIQISRVSSAPRALELQSQEP